MKQKFTSLTLTSAILISALTLSACQSEKSLETTDLMTGIKAANHETVKPDDALKAHTAISLSNCLRNALTANQTL